MDYISKSVDEYELEGCISYFMLNFPDEKDTELECNYCECCEVEFDFLNPYNVNGELIEFDFGTAIQIMKQGIKVTRKNHGEIYLNDKVIVNRFEDLNLPICFNLEDIEATDWMFVG